MNGVHCLTENSSSAFRPFVVRKAPVATDGAGTLDNGVAGQNRLMERLKKVLPNLWPPLDMVNKTVFVYIDLLNIQEVDEKGSIGHILL